MLLKEIFPQLLKQLLLMRRVARICWRFCLDLTFFIVLRLKCDIIFLLQQSQFFCVSWSGFFPLPEKKKKDYWVNVQLCKADNLNILGPIFQSKVEGPIIDSFLGGKSSFKNAGRFHRRDINLIALFS